MASTTDTVAANLRALDISDKEASSSPCTDPADHKSRCSSRDSSTTATTITHGLSPTANEFKPTFGPVRPPTSSSNEWFEIRQIPEKGVGLIASRDIPIGTRIIFEAPLLAIPINILSTVWGEYCQLGPAEKRTYDSFYYHNLRQAEFENVARGMLDADDDDMSPDDKNAFIQDAARVMNIFATNNILIANGAHAVFAETSRVNHSCVPNIHHSFNPDLGKQTVHALHHIQMGEELQITYMGQAGVFSTRSQRWEHLRHNYGFTCQCTACMDETGVNDHRRNLMAHLVYGIEQFRQGAPPQQGQLIPDSLSGALAQAMDVVKILVEDRLYGTELIRAHHLTSELALETGDYHQALESAISEVTVERNIMGMERDDLFRQGIASEQWIEKIRNTMMANNVPIPKPKKKFLRSLLPGQDASAFIGGELKQGSASGERSPTAKEIKKQKQKERQKAKGWKPKPPRKCNREKGELKKKGDLKEKDDLKKKEENKENGGPNTQKADGTDGGDGSGSEAKAGDGGEAKKTE